MQQGQLLLSDGTSFSGRCSTELTSAGEVVFTTGMTGYVESLTDPSYAGQILTFTYPLIGNYGVPGPDVWESSKIHAVGVVTCETCQDWSHHAGARSFGQWLEDEGVALIDGVDTRALTKRLRDGGVTLGAIVPEGTEAPPLVDPNARHLIEEVSCREEQLYTHPEATKTVIAVDCGMKENILRLLRELPLNIRRVPATYDYSGDSFDGVFLSNGPGDPKMAQTSVEVLKKAMQKEKPIFGICMGAQLMGQAAGAKTYKLRFGHRGQNQPVQEVATERCFITSQNHGFAVEKESLAREWEVTHINLNDGSVEGIAHRELPFRAVQYHPEAAPGPTDTQFLFQQFYEAVV